MRESKSENDCTSLSGPHGVDLRDHVAIVLAAHKHIVAAPEGRVGKIPGLKKNPAQWVF